MVKIKGGYILFSTFLPLRKLLFPWPVNLERAKGPTSRLKGKKRLNHQQFYKAEQAGRKVEVPIALTTE